MQYLFDKGHMAEAVGRLRAESMLGQDLFPVVAESDDGYIMASFDGLTLDGTVCYECKLWSKSKAESVASNVCPASDYPQVQQQLLISGADYCLYMLCDPDDTTKQASMEVYPDPGYQQAIIAGWKRFDLDVKNYVHTPDAEVLVGEPVATLPTIVYKLNGLALTSNLAEYKQAALQLVADSKKLLETDQDFANCEMQIKAFKEAEKRIDAVRAQVVGEVVDIDKFQRELGDIGELIRQARLNGEKQVKTRKDTIRSDIQQAAQSNFNLYIADLNSRLDRPFMPPIAINTGEAMRGKKTITSLHDAADTELARAQIEADRVFKIINENLNNLKSGAADYQFLFTDAKELVQKDAESVLAIINQRITKYKADEQAKVLAAAERERRAKGEIEEAKVPALGPLLSAPTGLMRPSDSAIVYVIERFYCVPTKTAVEWLKGIDFDNLGM